jgi:hypothetical protein
MVERSNATITWSILDWEDGGSNPPREEENESVLQLLPPGPIDV